jgi:hypothetical protein
MKRKFFFLLFPPISRSVSENGFIKKMKNGCEIDDVGGFTKH